MITSKRQRTAASIARRPLTKTQRNGMRARRAESDWKDLLEMRTFAPIKSKQVRRNTAMLLENQWQHLNEAATNTSIFGPANGATAGALSATDSYATGDNRLPRVLLPMVRRIYPALMSNETVGVQPMPGPVAMAFAIRYRYLRGANAAGDSAVNHRHRAESPYNPHGIKGVETVVLVENKVGTFTLPTAAGQETGDLTVTLISGLHDVQNTDATYPAKIEHVKIRAIETSTSSTSKLGYVLSPLGYLVPDDKATTL